MRDRKLKMSGARISSKESEVSMNAYRTAEATVALVPASLAVTRAYVRSDVRDFSDDKTCSATHL
jgi:hypothetical protein